MVGKVPDIAFGGSGCDWQVPDRSEHQTHWSSMGPVSYCHRGQQRNGSDTGSSSPLQLGSIIGERDHFSEWDGRVWGTCGNHQSDDGVVSWGRGSLRRGYIIQSRAGCVEGDSRVTSAVIAMGAMLFVGKVVATRTVRVLILNMRPELSS